MKKKIFISYSHADKKVVKQFAFQLSLRGFDLWVDEKDVSFGGNYTTAILRGIHEADLYLVFLSQNSIQSSWVEAEIDFALRESIERKNLTIVPVRLDDSEIPVPLSNIDYVDARYSIESAAEELAERFGSKQQTGTEQNENIYITSVSFEIAKKTAVEVGPFNEGITVKELEDNRSQILYELRKKAHGILMNFVPAEDFDFQCPLPKYKNGIYEEEVQRLAGSTAGSICERVSVEAAVFNPDDKKLKRLLEERLNILNINAITFGFTIPLEGKETLSDVGKDCLSKLQENYIILSYDIKEGAKVEIAKDFYLSFMVTESIFKIKLASKYEFQFENHMKQFSVINFLESLIQK